MYIHKHEKLDATSEINGDRPRRAVNMQKAENANEKQAEENASQRKDQHVNTEEARTMSRATLASTRQLTPAFS